MGQKLSCLGLPRSCPMFLFIWLFFYILYNKAIIISIALSVSSLSHSRKLLHLIGGGLQLVSKVEAILWNQAP